jgi:catechol 2,3-dioxygenase-like lactoylglutathione lyase family enzyme
MKCSQFYPVIMTADVAGTAAFYRDNFRFQVIFENDWYVHLQSAEDPRANIGIVRWDHETIPEVGRREVSGLLINFEVEDVDAEYRRIEALGLPILLPLRSEAFGQRHFILSDPNGVLIDVITPIPPSEEYRKLYAPGYQVAE